MNASRQTAPSSDRPNCGAAFPYLGPDAIGALGLLGGAIYIYSFGTKQIAWSNQAALRFWSATSAQELESRVLTPFSDATRIRLEEYLAAFHRGETRNESWTYYPSGIASTAMIRCTGVRIDSHNEAMLVEITELAPQDMPRAESRTIEALRSIPLMISLFSPNGEVLMRNPAAQHCFHDLDLAQAPGSDHFAAMFAEPGVAASLRAEVAAGGTARRTATMATPRGPVHALQVTAVSDPATGMAALLVAQDDVSKIVQITRQLVASEEALDSVLSLNVAPALVLSADEGRVLKANHAIEALFGTPLTTQHRAECIFHEQSAFEQLRDAVLARGGCSTQVKLKAAGGGAPWALVSAAAITYDKRASIVIFITDVDKLYKIAANLEAALDTERETNAAQRRILAIASHDFRTPLSIIDSAAQRMERQAATLTPDEIVARATRIRSAVQRLVELLDNTLERARRNEPAMAYAPAPGQLADSISAVAHSFEESERGPFILIRLPFLPIIHFDRALIEQALANLLENAIKYSHGRPHIEITATAGSEAVAVLIRDRGIGVPEAEWRNVFSENVRGSNVASGMGTGLGLSIVRQIINLHGGLVEIVPTDGLGTTVRITLPRALASAPQNTRAAGLANGEKVS